MSLAFATRFRRGCAAGRRPPCQFASRGAIEINADAHRLDLPAEWIPHARERGIPCVISVDAHSTAGLSVLPLGVSQARRGALRRHEVLNALTVHEFAQRVRPAA